MPVEISEDIRIVDRQQETISDEEIIFNENSRILLEFSTSTEVKNSEISLSKTIYLPIEVIDDLIENIKQENFATDIKEYIVSSSNYTFVQYTKDIGSNFQNVCPVCKDRIIAENKVISTLDSPTISVHYDCRDGLVGKLEEVKNNKSEILSEILSN